MEIQTKLKDFSLQAFVSALVHILALGLLTAFYYFFHVLDHYLAALFWACIVSIPMFQIKVVLHEIFVSHVAWYRSENTISLHWLGMLRRYESREDFFRRDWPFFRGVITAVVDFAWRPFKDLLSDTAQENGSWPYFNLLLRLCFIEFWCKNLGMKAIIFILFHGLRLYLVLVAVRVILLLLSYMLPRMMSRFVSDVAIQRCKAAFSAARSFILWCLRGLKSWAHKVLDVGVQWLDANIHWILSMTLTLAAISICFYCLCVFCISLRHETILIWDTLAKQLHSQPLFNEMMIFMRDFGYQSGGQHASNNDESQGGVGSAVSFFHSLLQTNLPGYHELLRESLPGFALVKYLIYDMWETDAAPHKRSAGFDAFSSMVAPSAEDIAMCAEAVALGASCEAVPNSAPGGYSEPLKPLPQQLNITTSLLREVVKGNISAIASLGWDAYTEIASSSGFLGMGEMLKGDSADLLRDGAMHGGSWLATFTRHTLVFSLGIVTQASAMLGQIVVFVTALFYLLAANKSCLEQLRLVLRIIDGSDQIFNSSEKVIQAVLFSALKMSAFHSLFTWLLYSWAQSPVVVVPTMLSALVAFFPVVSPVWCISWWIAVYLWMHNETNSSVACLVASFSVYWQVPTAIYAEIPDSNAWLTSLGVVLGISQFGVAGVFVGPLIASVPLVCLNLLRLFSDTGEEECAERRRSRRGTLLGYMDSLRYPIPGIAQAATPPPAQSPETQSECGDEEPRGSSVDISVQAQSSTSSVTLSAITPMSPISEEVTPTSPSIATEELTLPRAAVNTPKWRATEWLPSTTADSRRRKQNQGRQNNQRRQRRQSQVHQQDQWLE